jgi:hypothetical protein
MVKRKTSTSKVEEKVQGIFWEYQIDNSSAKTFNQFEF